MRPTTTSPDLLPELLFEPILTRLSKSDPDSAKRAERAINLSLAGARDSIWPEVAWSSSTLTPGGYPLEFAWSSADPAIRWTAEVAGPEMPVEARLSHAVTVLHALGQDVAVPAVLDGVAGRGNRFGTWLGGRHKGGSDRYKLYLELGTADGWAVLQNLLPERVVTTIPPRTSWRMVGYSADNGIVEFYGRVARQEIWEIERLLSISGLDPTTLITLTAGLTRRDLHAHPLPGTTGLSLAVDRNGVVVAGGWFALSRHLLGHDQIARRAISRVIEQQGWCGDFFEAIVADAGCSNSRFGMVGAGVDAAGTPSLQLGCRP